MTTEEGTLNPDAEWAPASAAIDTTIPHPARRYDEPLPRPPVADIAADGAVARIP